MAVCKITRLVYTQWLHRRLCCQVSE